jgi:hypothetical protein
MPRSNIPARLVHRIKEVEVDSRRLDSLYLLVARKSIPIVYEALKRETSFTAADAWIEIAKSVLSQLTKENFLGSDAKDLKMDLAQHLNAKDLRQPDEEDVKETANDLARSIVPGWLEILRRAAPQSQKRLLTESLLPAGEDDDSWRSLMLSVSNTPLNQTEVSEIISAMRDELFRDQFKVELPLGIIIVREELHDLRVGPLAGPRYHYYAEGSRAFWDQTERS